MTQELVTWVNPNDLKEGRAASELYSTPENYHSIKENILQVGILTPLHVIDDVVISGNLRLRIAKELNFDLVPVLYVEQKENMSDELLAVSYGQQRQKKYSELLKEYEILEAAYPVGKGKRTDLNPELKKNIEKRNQLNLSKDKVSKLKSIKALSKELYGVDTNEYEQIWKEVDQEKASLNRILKSLKREQALKANKIVLPEHFNLNLENAKVFNKSCSDMSEVEDKSIACIITSPPYFQMKDYGTGAEQRGMESEVEEYIDGLINDFKDCIRVLKDDGSLWVNINEPVNAGEYFQISHLFALRMRKEGWILNDEIIWIKNNPQFTQAKRSVRAHEYIFHFVKTSKYHYDISWLSEVIDSENRISLGTKGKVWNLISGLDFRNNTLRTNSNNMSDLRKSCKENGFTLTHSAGFPITVPLIPILTTSKVGDTILDIYSGTGTTGEAALSIERKFIGYEIKPEFIKATEVRLSICTQEIEKEKIEQAA
jgi:DNA modification methylase/ParB-like chromosome segregation protein Spo0J